MYKGIDVSHWNNLETIQSLYDNRFLNKIDFAYIKAGEGLDYYDPMCEINAESARRSNVAVGFYWFVTQKQLDSRDKWGDLIKTMCSKIPYHHCMPVMLDYEQRQLLNKRAVYDELLLDFAASLRKYCSLKYDDRVGIYASHAVLESNQLARNIDAMGMYIWDARYKYKSTNIDIYDDHLGKYAQEYADGVEVDFNQITSKVLINGVNVDLDLDVGWGLERWINL